MDHSRTEAMISNGNSGHLSNMSKSPIIIMTLFLLKKMSNKTILIMPKRTVRAGLNLIDPLISDQTDTWGTRHKIHVSDRSREVISSTIVFCHSG
jgi:hypothetical protein